MISECPNVTVSSGENIEVNPLILFHIWHIIHTRSVNLSSRWSSCSGGLVELGLQSERFIGDWISSPACPTANDTVGFACVSGATAFTSKYTLGSQTRTKQSFGYRKTIEDRESVSARGRETVSSRNAVRLDRMWESHLEREERNYRQHLRGLAIYLSALNERSADVDSATAKYISQFLVTHVSNKENKTTKVFKKIKKKFKNEDL